MQLTTTKHCKQHCGFAVIILYIQYVVYKDSKAILSFLEQALMGIGQGHTLLNVSTFFNPLTPMSDQEKTSPYNLSTISSRKVMRIKQNMIQGILS